MGDKETRYKREDPAGFCLYYGLGQATGSFLEAEAEVDCKGTLKEHLGVTKTCNILTVVVGTCDTRF